LLSWTTDAGSFVVEDDYGGDRALYAANFSKVLSPGLQLGYLILPEALPTPFADTIRSGRAGNSSFDNAALTDFDFAIDLVPEAYGTDLERHPCLQRLVAAKAASPHCLADSAFDFTLRCDADYLEKLADGHIEPIFVHARFLPEPERDDGIGLRIQLTVVRIVGVISGRTHRVVDGSGKAWSIRLNRRRLTGSVGEMLS
jgi:hypothetical protein